MGLLDNFRNRRTSAIGAIQKAMEQPKQGDENLYYPERDQEGGANVIVRFLPQKDPDKVPFVSRFRHIFRDQSGRWVWLTCPTSVGKNCPICAKNGILYRSGNPEWIAVSRERKRKKEYYANILVVKDSRSPEKEGKVFVLKFGQSIMDKLMSAIQPKYDGEEPMNPFDIWEGADFYLRIRRDSKSKQITYEDSKFASKSEIFAGDEAKQEWLISQCHDLDVYLQDIKPDDELDRMSQTLYAQYFAEPTYEYHSTAQEPRQTVAAPKFEEATVKPSESSDDDVLSSFKAMVEEVPF